MYPLLLLGRVRDEMNRLRKYLDQSGTHLMIGTRKQSIQNSRRVLIEKQSWKGKVMNWTSLSVAMSYECHFQPNLFDPVSGIHRRYPGTQLPVASQSRCTVAMYLVARPDPECIGMMRFDTALGICTTVTCTARSKSARLVYLITIMEVLSSNISASI